MKFCLTVIVLLLNLNLTFCQLKIDEKSKVYFSSSQSDIVQFITDNHFDYALIVWASSTWISSKDEIHCFIKQRNKWYLAKISKEIYAQHVFKVDEHKLNKIEVDSIKRLFNVAETFKYNQNDFNKLPESCEYKINENESLVYIINDASTLFLLQLSNKEIKTLNYYAPNELLKNCYPQIKEYGILKGFVNTIDQLYIKTRNFK